MSRVMNAVRRFARTKDSGELFHEAQRRHVAFGEVQTVPQVAANPQLEFRNTFRAVDGFPEVRMPSPFAVVPRNAVSLAVRTRGPVLAGRAARGLEQPSFAAADVPRSLSSRVPRRPASHSRACASWTSRGCWPGRSRTASWATSVPTC